MFFFNIRWIYFLSAKGQHVAELVQRTQQLVANVQQVGSQRRGHVLQILLVVLHAALQCGQLIVCSQRHVRQIGTRVLGTQHFFNEAVHLLGQRLVQVVRGLVHRIAVRAPVMQLNNVQHFCHGGHYAVRAVFRASLTVASLTVASLTVASLTVASLIASLTVASLIASLIVSLIASLIVSLS